MLHSGDGQAQGSDKKEKEGQEIDGQTEDGGCCHRQSSTSRWLLGGPRSDGTARALIARVTYLSALQIRAIEQEGSSLGDLEVGDQTSREARGHLGRPVRSAEPAGDAIKIWLLYRQNRSLAVWPRSTRMKNTKAPRTSSVTMRSRQSKYLWNSEWER